MPNYDGGHYFLTALIPVRSDEVIHPSGETWVTSHLHCLREVLATMPRAQQTWATEQTGLNSPFARDPRTHFARLVVVDDVAFGGRLRRDPIWTTLLGLLGGLLKRRFAGTDPAVHDRADHLPHAYLIFVCDFDAASDDPAELDGYLRGLWQVMEPEWRSALKHCEGYDRITGAEGFAKLIRDCQVETTMSFNDYYVPFPALPSAPFLAIAAPLLVSLLALLVGLLGGIVAGILGMSGRFWWWLALAGLVATPLTGLLAYRQVVAAGMRPFPAGRRTDLPGVTKALYLQQHFTRFAIAEQESDPATLHQRFGAFLRAHRPDDTAAPTQARGTVRS
jgi:hypothetical protein